jgi:DNA repair exonuclease SbcCD ATPase subunit
MRFLSIEITNFLSYIDTTTINLANRGLVGVFGVNGAGKSGFTTDALTWCLWGETVRNVDKDQVVNNQSGKDCKVSLTLEDNDELFTIVRTRSCTTEKKRNDLRIFTGREKNEVTSGTVHSTQNLVNTVVGLDFKTFVQSVLLSAGDIPSFCRLTDDEKKEVLEDILRINVIRKARDVVKEKISSKINKLNALEVEYESIESQKAAVVSRLDSLQEPFNSFELQKKITIEEINNLIRNQDKEIYNINLELEALSELEWEKEQLESKLSIENNILKSQEDIGNRNLNKLQAVEKEAEINFATCANELTKLEKQKANILRLNGSCPTCLQPVHDKDNILQKLEEEIQEAASRRDSFKNVKDTIKLARTKEFSALLEELQELKDKGKELEKLIAAKSKQVDRINNFQLILPHLLQRKTDLTRKLEEEKNRENPYINLIYLAKQEIKSLDNKLRIVKARVRKLNYEVSHLRYWDVGFSNSGIKSYIIENAIPFLNARARRYSETMSNGKISITFSSTSKLKSGESKEKFNVEVVNEAGANIYEGNSSGERKRSDFAIGWALADLAATRSTKPIRFRGLDEPFESLDAEGVEAVFRLLNSAVNDYETIFCITHDQSLQNKFQRKMLVEKVNGQSRITDA